MIFSVDVHPKIVALVAFLWLFSTVRFHMLPQMAFIKGFIVAYVAFVWLFSTVHFQMILQTPCQRRGKVTLVAFVLLLLRIHSRIRCICLIFLHCAFSNDPSNSVPEKRHNRIGCICLNFLHCAFYMLPQMIFIRGRIVAYVAFVWLFSTVRLQMFP